MLKLEKLLAAWNKADFDSVAKEELQKLDAVSLPLQQGLAQSSYVADDPVSVIIMSSSEQQNVIKIKAGLFYSGIIAGCSCSDDPTPLDKVNEYCEVFILIDKTSGEASISMS
ncbi:MAG: hypothetical protein OEY00_01835 [Gammaproteobacteria bacterium]|nr:hypothetical protein [Gammaproteobacteria bacterium]